MMTTAYLTLSVSLLFSISDVPLVWSLSTTLPSRASKTSQTNGRPISTSQRASHTYRTIIDGPSWENLRESPLIVDDNDNAVVAASSMGSLEIVTGTCESTQEPVIGLLASSGNNNNNSDNETTTVALTGGQVLWKESVARMQAGVATDAAAATYAAALTHLYPLTATQAAAVGGSEETFRSVAIPDGAVVILGGNPEAVWAAQALAALGSKSVTLVSPKKPSVAQSIAVLSPNDDKAFCQSVGKFEAVLDTVGREGSNSRAVELLARRHGCTTYRSTRTKAEEIVGSEGLLFGPGKAKQYLKSLGDKSTTDITPTAPVAGWGALVEQLLQAKVLAPPSSFETVDKVDKATTWVRGWSLKATWETNTWPSTTDGTRFGFPTRDEEEEDEEEDDDVYDYDDEEKDEDFFVVDRDNLPARVQARSKQARETQEDDRVVTRSKFQPSSVSPYILTVYGSAGLEEDVIDEELDCILFMSAPFCRTCRKLQAPYARLARLNFEDEDSEVIFAKADIVGSFGKALGKTLGVNAVPCFVLFRKGERFGKALNISRLPHPQLDLALKFLKERQDWDDTKFESNDSNQPRTKI